MKLLSFGYPDISIGKKDQQSYCIDIASCHFDYGTQRKVMTGKSGMSENDRFIVKRVFNIKNIILLCFNSHFI